MAVGCFRCVVHSQFTLSLIRVTNDIFNKRWKKHMIVMFELWYIYMCLDLTISHGHAVISMSLGTGTMSQLPIP